MTAKKPIQVWIKYKDNGAWEHVFDTDSPPRAREYAENRISFGGVSRVEIRDAFGRKVLETVFDQSWR